MLHTSCVFVWLIVSVKYLVLIWTWSLKLMPPLGFESYVQLLVLRNALLHLFDLLDRRMTILHIKWTKYLVIFGKVDHGY